MKTLKDKMQNAYDDTGINEMPLYQYYSYEDIKETLQNFYNDYWKLSKQGDKFKHYISCDELDLLMDKHFNIIHIETLQQLPNQDKEVIEN